MIRGTILGQKYKRKNQASRTSSWLALIFVLVVFALWFLFDHLHPAHQGQQKVFSSVDPRQMTESVVDQDSPAAQPDPHAMVYFQKRVEEHKHNLGIKLNSERIHAEYENRGLVARPIPAVLPVAPSPAAPGLLNSQPDPVYQNPDMQIETALRDEKAQNEQNKWEREQYVRELVARGHAAGYRVHVDKNNNVEWEAEEGDRMPQSMGPATLTPTYEALKNPKLKVPVLTPIPPPLDKAIHKTPVQ